MMAEAHGRKTTVHLALEDASGHSAIVEYIEGKPVVHHGPQYRIMTNDPTCDEQLELLAAQDYSNPSRDMPLPGNVNARDRFQRAAHYAALLPEPGDAREAVAGVLAIVRNCSVPFGAPYGEFGIYNTEYRTVCDLTNGRYFCALTTSPNVIWMESRLPDGRVRPASGGSVPVNGGRPPDEGHQGRKAWSHRADLKSPELPTSEVLGSASGLPFSSLA